MNPITESPLNVLLNIILKTYFFNTHCLLFLTESTKKIDVETELPTIHIHIENNNLNPKILFRHHGCQDIIIHHANTTVVFSEFERLIRLQHERYNYRRYIVVEEEPMQISALTAASYVSDLLILVPRNDTYDLMTHRVGTVELRLLNRWFPHNETFLTGDSLFPDKFKDQEGAVLKVGTFAYEPYSIVGDDSIDGTEANLIFEFVKKYNLTPAYTLIGDELWGDIYENWTGIGILGAVLNDEVDVGYAAIYTWEEYYNYIDYTKPFTRTGITSLVPAPKIADGWFTPFFSFSLVMWASIFGVLVLTTVLLIIMINNETSYGIKESFDKSVSTMVRLYLLQSISLPLEAPLMRFFMGLNLIYIVLVSSCYGSGLASVMTVPRYQKAIKTVVDLAESRLEWGAPTDAWLISLRHVTGPEYQAIKDRFVVKTEPELVKASQENNFGFSLERLPYGHYAVGDYVKSGVIPDYRIMQEDIYWEQCIFIVRKNSVLLPLLDLFILRIFEAGIGAYWENQVVDKYMDVGVQRGIEFFIHHTQDHGLVKLKWFHVKGAFAILIFGNCFSAIIFVFEISRQKLKSHNYHYIS